MDLQAMDRAHRIGQKKEVQVGVSNFCSFLERMSVDCCSKWVVFVGVNRLPHTKEVVARGCQQCDAEQRSGLLSCRFTLLMPLKLLLGVRARTRTHTHTTHVCACGLQVFRLCIENSIEEKVIEKAYKKLRLDALVIQQGRLTDNSQNKVRRSTQGSHINAARSCAWMHWRSNRVVPHSSGLLASSKCLVAVHVGQQISTVACPTLCRIDGGAVTLLHQLKECVCVMFCKFAMYCALPALLLPEGEEGSSARGQGGPDEHGAVRRRDGVQLGAHQPHGCRCVCARVLGAFPHVLTPWEIPFFLADKWRSPCLSPWECCTKAGVFC
eukprot:scaffold76063_cov21-Tisochrysis_lutea.AAC.1